MSQDIQVPSTYAKRSQIFNSLEGRIYLRNPQDWPLAAPPQRLPPTLQGPFRFLLLPYSTATDYSPMRYENTKLERVYLNCVKLGCHFRVGGTVCH